MTTHDLLVEAVIDALVSLFNDRDVDANTTISDLTGICDEIDIMIESLQELDDE